MWALAAGCWLGGQRLLTKPMALPLLFSAVAAASLMTVAVASVRQQRLPPTLDPLDVTMPATMQWLRSHTPAGSVIFCTGPFAAELPLFTDNRIYWGGLADQSVISNSEAAARTWDTGNWTPQSGGTLHYPADYSLGAASDCAAKGVDPLVNQAPLYVNQAEDTCILQIGR
jgi:hypothetical protein